MKTLTELRTEISALISLKYNLNNEIVSLLNLSQFTKIMFKPRTVETISQVTKSKRILGLAQSLDVVRLKINDLEYLFEKQENIAISV